MKRSLIWVVSILMMITAVTFLSRESFYAKQTYGEVILHTLIYGYSDQLAQASRILKNEQSVALDIPILKQESRLSCEVAALRMALAWHDINVSEEELLSRLAYSTKSPIEDNVWGDPEEGFVGDPDGSLSKGTGYGVYEGPIRELARYYGRPTVVLESTNVEAIANLVSSGKPVIVWMDIDTWARPIFWQTPSSKEVRAHPGEHARVVLGFTGDADAPKRVILNDPIYGRVTISTQQFLKEWDALDRRALVVN